jgi:hypothetical protein
MGVVSDIVRRQIGLSRTRLGNGHYFGKFELRQLNIDGNCIFGS